MGMNMMDMIMQALCRKDEPCASKILKIFERV